jgi:peptidoglycan/LPS O-acetylase OafA/YrhL
MDIQYLKEKAIWFWLYAENWLFAKEGWPDGANFILSHFWSLAIEEQYYLAWPLLIYLFRNKLQYFPVLISVLIIAALTYRIAGNLGNPGFYVITFARMDSLLIGSLVAVSAYNYRVNLQKIALPLLLLSGAVISSFIALSTNLTYNNRFFSSAGYTIIAIFFACILVLSFREGGLLNRTLNMAWLKLLGRYSYGLYVFHFPVFYLVRPAAVEWFEKAGPAVLVKMLATVLVLVVTGLLSVLSYHFLEVRFLRMKKHFE